MGMFKKSVTVSNLFDMDKRFQANFWVDTGALYFVYCLPWGEKPSPLGESFSALKLRHE
ncbi:MAG: hypothetical protein BECKG1743D_GA0114223_103335 [Candidatus Kentron sp. G]|nr:MAG: hypothetical protein BECKG1743F_GA0114225_103194 [Candidatus Kentron sp. G]VFN02070.1 MAG: hypothetical protein BECKG1743D_GA0114223_103335 [Candidatus Kentron sp. G]VFN04068.1 MAG: hypothetical protein BECKG1743E_GA0114224_106872 [Candidatus Kentron sp. G]